jgi:hypothetical protein
MKSLAQLENSARFTALRPRPPRSCPDPYFAPSFKPSSSIDSCSYILACPSSAFVPTPANFNPSPSLHSICIRPASAAPAASF